MNGNAYALHRWVSLAVIVQLLLWAASGLFFAIAPIEGVRGQDRVARRAPAQLPWGKKRA